MKIRILTLLFSAFIIGASYAHDDLVYRTASEWSFDAGNQSTISETYGSAFLGGAVVADYNGDGIPDICKRSNIIYLKRNLYQTVKRLQGTLPWHWKSRRRYGSFL